MPLTLATGHDAHKEQSCQEYKDILRPRQVPGTLFSNLFPFFISASTSCVSPNGFPVAELNLTALDAVQLHHVWASERDNPATGNIDSDAEPSERNFQKCVNGVLFIPLNTLLDR